MGSVMDDDTVPVVESSITVHPSPPTNPRPSIPSSVSLLSCIFGPAKRPMASLRNLWNNYYPAGAFGEEGPLMPGSALNFIIGGLLALVEIKSQGNTGFPFETNPRTMRVSINCLIMYAVASAAEHFFSVGRPAPTSVYTIVARLGRIISLGAKDSEIDTTTTNRRSTLCNT